MTSHHKNEGLYKISIDDGYLIYRIRFAGVAEIDDIAVIGKRRSGTGRKMVEELVSTLNSDVVTVFAFCRSANTDAHLFYKSVGFTEVVDVPDFYKDEDKGVKMFVRRLER